MKSPVRPIDTAELGPVRVRLPTDPCNPRLVILESPYAGRDAIAVGLNIRYARRCLRASLLRGEAPIASHLLYTQPGVLKDGIPEERAMGIAAGLAWARVADGAVFYLDRGWSEGMRAALAVHEAAGTPIEYREIGA